MINYVTTSFFLLDKHTSDLHQRLENVAYNKFWLQRANLYVLVVNGTHYNWGPVYFGKIVTLVILKSGLYLNYLDSLNIEVKVS